ncbi:MAG: hypothetical protein VX641_00195 [Planctomycetota bacterium]|nr:hypothetical protein [Planctomycetota bacterium]
MQSDKVSPAKVMMDVPAQSGSAFLLSALAAALLAFVQSTSADDAPANDSCIDAARIEAGQVQFSNIGASTDGPLQSACSTFGSEVTWNDLWFIHEASEDGILEVSTCNSIDFDSRISVYSGSCTDGELLEIACNDDAEGCLGYSSRVLAECNAGEEYLIRIGSFTEGDTGSGTLDVQVVPSCFNECSLSSQMELEPCGMTTNDGCNSAAYSSQSDITIFHEVVSLDVPLCGTWFCDGTFRDTDWYAFEVPEPGAMVTTTLQSSELVVGYLYLARFGCPLEVIDYQYGNCPTILPERWLTAGFYRAIVAPGFESIAQCSSAGPESRYELLLSVSDVEIPYPENDDCGDATMVADGMHPFTNYYSTTDGQTTAPEDCSEYGPQISADVWFAYEASCTGKVTATACETADFDTRFEVWKGGCTGEMLACNDDGQDCEGYTSRVTFDAVCGETYHLRIGGYQGARGEGMVEFSCEGSCCAADLDGDGFVAGSDLAILLGAWSSSDSRLDFNGDGAVDGADLAVLLGAWGAC